MSERNEKLYTQEQTAFELGVFSTKDPAKLELNAVQKCENAFPSRFGRIKKRPGYEAINASPFSNAVRGVRRFRPEGEDTGVIISWDARNVGYTEDASGTYTQLGRNYTRLSTDTVTPASPGIVHEEWADAVYFSDGVTGLDCIKKAATAQAAGITLDDWDDPYSLVGVVDVAGAAGNAYTAVVLDPGAPSQALSVGIDGTAITVNLATDASGNCISTAAQVEAALDASGGGIAAVTTWSVEAGTEIVVPKAVRSFINGADIGDLYLSKINATESFTYLARRTAAERLFGISAADKGNVKWCDSFTPATWNALSVLSPGGEFISMLEIDRSFMLFQADRILRIDGTDPTTWELAPVGSEGLGCVAPETVEEVEGVAVYYSPRGVAYFDGSRPSPLSDAVYNVADTAHSLLPYDADLYDGAFTVQSHEFIYFFYKSAAANAGCDRAMVLDFRTGAWGGPYKFGFQATCGCQDLTATGDEGALTLGTSTGYLIRETADLYTDLGSEYTMSVSFKTIDADRPTLDKVFRGVRIGYKVGGTSNMTVSMLSEDETASRTNCSRLFTLTGAVEDVVTMALPAGYRSKAAWVNVEHAYHESLELFSQAVDLFFVRTR